MSFFNTLGQRVMIGRKTFTLYCNQLLQVVIKIAKIYLKFKMKMVLNEYSNCR